MHRATPTNNSYKRIWDVSMPIIIGLVAQNLMVVIDTAFLGRLGEVTLGAAAIGGIFYLTMVMLGTGFSVGTQIMIGRRNGEKKYRHIGRIFDHAIYFMLLLAILVFILLSQLAPKFLSWFLSSEQVLKESLVFLSYRKFGIFFGFLILCFNALYVGKTRTMVLSISTILMASVNIVLDYTLIFGHFGFPEMGIAGAALATNIAELSSFIFFVIWSATDKKLADHHLFRFYKPHVRLYKPLLKLAMPVMFQFFFSFSAWFIFFLIIEQIGETALAASNITRSVYMLLMIPVWGLSSASNTLVSNTIGEGDSELVMPLIKKILMISITSSFLVVLPTLLFVEDIISFFTNDPYLIAATIPLFYVIGLALLVFAVGMILFSALSGTGKTLTALRIEMISIAIYLTVAFLLATGWKASAEMVWLVEVLYFGMLGSLAYWYLRKGDWKNQHI